MKIDRTRALMFVGLLAASGCVITTEDDDEPTGQEAGAPGEGGSPTTTGGKSSTGGSSAAGEGPSEGGAGGAPASLDEGGSGGEAESAGGATAGSGGAPSGGTSGSGGATGGNASGTTGGAAPTDEGMGGEAGAGTEPEPICSDAEGVLGGCDMIEVDPSCEGIGNFQVGKCESAATYFKPRVAELIQFCIQQQAPEELCDASLTYACADAAILDSCPDDDEALDACASILTACPEVEVDSCIAYLSAMTTLGKEETITCMEEGLFCDLYSCAEGL